MQTAAIHIGKHEHYISYQKSEKEYDPFIYTGSILLGRKIEFGYTLIDENHIVVTAPVTVSDAVQSAIVRAIRQNESNHAH